MSSKRLIVIGASGLIGTALMAAAKAADLPVVGTYTTRPRRGLYGFDLLTGPIHRCIPDLNANDSVVVLSSYVAQAWIYQNREQARLLNVEATIRVLSDVLASGAHATFLSTEAIFGDAPIHGHTEQAAPAPTTLYAKMKLEVEGFLANAAGPSCVARSGWVVGQTLGERCPVAQTYQSLLSGNAQIAEHNIFTITHVSDLASGLLKIATARHTGILHLAANPPVERRQLADLIIHNSQFKNQMGYSVVPFENFCAVEQKPRSAWLCNKLFTQRFSIQFRNPTDTIQEKVRALDYGRSLELLEPAGL